MCSFANIYRISGCPNPTVWGCGQWMQKESDADRRCPLKDYIISCKKLTCTEVSVKGKDKDSMQKILVCT